MVYLTLWNFEMRMHDTDSGSPTTERNLENVFQLIHRINFTFFFFLAKNSWVHEAYENKEDDVQHWPYPHSNALQLKSTFSRCIHPLTMVKASTGENEQTYSFTQ